MIRKFRSAYPSAPAYWKLLFGRVVTNAGDSFYFVATMWLVFELTGSAFFTGLAGFLVRVPSAMMFLVGPLVDRWDVKRTLIRTQLTQAVVIITVPAAIVTDTLSVYHLLLVVPALSMLNQFVYPAMNVALPRIVSDGELVRANSLFSVAYQGSNIALNALGGVLISVIGVTALYVLDFGTFLVACGVFAAVSLPGGDGSDEGSDDGSDDDLRTAAAEYRTEVLEGIDYVRGSLLVPVVSLAAVVNFSLGMSRGVLPAFASSVGGAETYGLILGALGAGKLLGSSLSSVIDDYRFGRITVVGFSAGTVAWFGAVTLPWGVQTLGLFAVAYVPIGVFNVIIFSSVQSAVPDQIIGRVVTLVGSASAVSLPVGSLVGGALAEQFSPRLTLLTTTAGLAFVAVYFLSFTALRSLPSVGEMDGTALQLE